MMQYGDSLWIWPKLSGSRTAESDWEILFMPILWKKQRGITRAIKELIGKILNWAIVNRYGDVLHETYLQEVAELDDTQAAVRQEEFSRPRERRTPQLGSL